MGHIPEDENFEEYMNASAEEWSKPEETPPQPKMKAERVNRWGSPIPEEGTVSDAKRWGSEQIEPFKPAIDPPKKKSGTKWWIIAIVIVVVLCLCLCISIFVLPALGVALPFSLQVFQSFFQSFQ